MTDDLAEHPHFAKWDTWELLSTRMLDTSFNRSERLAIDQVLRSRGIVGKKRLKMRLIVVGGLWWSKFALEWFSLGFPEILHGWALNAAFLAGGLAAFLTQELVSHVTELGSVLAWLIAVPAGLVIARVVFVYSYAHLKRRFPHDDSDAG